MSIQSGNHGSEWGDFFKVVGQRMIVMILALLVGSAKAQAEPRSDCGSEGGGAVVAGNPQGVIWGDVLRWDSVSNLPVARGLMGAAVSNGRIYAMGGYNGVWDSAVYSYDPSSPSQGWTSVAALPVGRACLTAASVGGKIYAMGGQNTDGFRSDVHVYDSQQPGLGWLSVSSLPAPLFRMASAVVNDKIYVVGGGATNGTQSAVYEYDPLQPVQGWRHLNDLPSPRENLAVAALDGKLYSIGGSINSTICSTVFVCDPSRPEQGWLSISNLPAARYVLAAVGLNGKLFAVGGFDGSQTGINTVYMYDPFRPTQGWLSVSSLPAVKGEAPCVSVNGKMYVISGASSPVTYQSSVFEGTFSSGVSPSAGSINGGTAVTITGSNLGDGSDITNVTLCGVVAGIVSQSSSQLVVNSARSDLATNGAVAVYSISGGVTVASNAFSYVAGSGDVSTVGLVGYYALDGNVMDSSGHGYDGSVFSAVPVDGGKRGGCYEFDGKANAIVVYNTALKNEFPAGSPITISAWVRVRAYHSDHTVIAAMDSGRWIQTRASIRLNEYGVPYYYGQTDFPPPLLSTLGPLRPTNGTSSRAFRAARLRACTSMDSWRWRV